MAEYIDKLQIGTGEEIPIRDSEAHELLGEHATTLESHMLNTNNPHGVTWQQVGAAPEVNARRLAFTIPAQSYASINFNGVTNALITCRSSVSSGYAALYYTGYAATAIRQSLTPIVGSSTVGFCLNNSDTVQGVTLYNNNSNNVLDVVVNIFLGNIPTVTYTSEYAGTIQYGGMNYSHVGAAPDGLVRKIYYVNSLTEFEANIEAEYNNMADCTERVIQMDLTSGTNEVHSGSWFITITRRNAAIGHLIMTSPESAMRTMQRWRYNGSWGPWEWINPPMMPGVEYCTTERYSGDSVYTQILNCGLLTHAKTIPIPTNFRVLRYAAHSNGYIPYPYSSPDSNYYRAVQIEYGQLTMLAGSASNGMEEVYCRIWYIKV